jgi:hypothetical protein
MKGRMLILVGLPFFVVLAFLMVGCTPKVAIHTEGTWVNEKQEPQKEIDTADGVWTQYLHISDTKVFYSGTGKVVGRWTDSEGNVWQKVLSTMTFPDAYKGMILAVLQKFSKNGNVRESVLTMPSSDAELKNPVFPSKIDPQDVHYEIYYRQEK